MKDVRKILILLISLAIVSLTISCDDARKATTTTEDSTTPEDPTTDPGAEPPVIQNSLKIDVASAGWSSILHNDTALATACEVSIDATTASDKYINCSLHVQELSSHFQTIDLQVTAPPQMCRYLRYDPYKFYNWEPGIGATEIWIQTQKNTDGDILGYKCFEGGASPTPTDPGDCTALTEWFVDKGSPVCRYNHTYRDSTFPNCCAGNYTLHTRDYDVDGAIISNPFTSTGEDWGNFDQQCFGGAAARDISWPKELTSNIPLPIIYESWLQGFDTTYPLTSPISLRSVGFGRTDILSNVNEYTGPVPVSMDTSYTDRSGSVLFAGDLNVQEDYEIWCLDESFEVKASINLKIRDWNTKVEYDNYVEGETSNPDVSGTEGVNCDYESPEGGVCNDFFDWNDVKADANYGDNFLRYPRHTW